MTDEDIGEMITPEEWLVHALAEGWPVDLWPMGAALVGACRVPVLGQMALSAFRAQPVGGRPPAHVDWVPDDPGAWIDPEPDRGPVLIEGTTPVVVYLLALARGERCDRLAETVDPRALALWVIRGRSEAGTSDVVARLEAIQRVEWARLRGNGS